MSRTKTNRLLEMALAARCAYPDHREQISELEFDLVDAFSIGSVEGYIGSTDKRIILAFRGSSLITPEYDSLSWMEKAFSEWGNHLDIQMIPFAGGMVQNSYLLQVQSAWPTISAKLIEHGVGTKKLIITGHSLGGGFALLAGAMAELESDLKVNRIFTFGAPRIANMEFASHYTAPVVRVENRNDLIPHLPPSTHLLRALRMLSTDIEDALVRWFGDHFVEMAYVPVGELLYINKKGKFSTQVHDRQVLLQMTKTMLFDPTQLLQDHWIDSYCSAIDALK